MTELQSQMSDFDNPALRHHGIVDAIGEPDAVLISVFIQITGGGEEDIRISFGYENVTEERDDALFEYALDLLEGQRRTWHRPRGK